MAGQTIKKRVRFFVAVEGESEQSFLVWLQVLAQKELHIHLDDVLLGGDVINWAQSILAGCGTDEEFFAQTARSERGARGLVFKLARDGGAGTWHNVRRQHTVADFVRSMLEGLAGQVAVMVRQFGEAASHRPVFAGGGGSRCPLFVQSPTCRSTESPTPCRARNPATCRSGGLPLAAPKSETSPNCLRALRP